MIPPYGLIFLCFLFCIPIMDYHTMTHSHWPVLYTRDSSRIAVLGPEGCMMTHGLNLSWLWRRNGLLSFLLYFPSHLLFPLRLIPLWGLWTSFCLLIYADSYCTVLTHPRILVLGPEGCTMTHGLIPWLTLFTLVCYRLRVLNYKYLVVAVVGP